MKRDITEPFLRTLMPPEQGRIEILDARQGSLAFRLGADGRASWSVRTRTRDGKQVRATLGEWPALGISEARKRTRVVLADVWRGADPTAEKRAAQKDRKARAAAPTVAARLADWQQARGAAWSARYAREVARVVRAEIIPALGSRPLTDLARADWTALIAATQRRSAAVGSMLFRTCNAFLSFAEANGWISAHPLPRKGAALLAPGVPSRERVLTDQELAAIWDAAGRLRPKSRAFVRLLLMTACREMEAADLSAGELDLIAGLWRLPAGRTKNGRTHSMPLHPFLLSDLQAVWPAHDPAPGYRLLGAIRGSGLRGFSAVKVRLDRASDVTGWRFHDLRRTARTTMTRIGVERDAAEAALNHVSHRTSLERVYDRSDQTVEAIAALKDWQAHLEALIERSRGPESAPLNART